MFFWDITLKKGYNFISLSDKRFHISKDIVFHKEVFPLSQQLQIAQFLPIPNYETTHDNSPT